MKHCKKCGAQKAVSEYYANDRTCKPCRKEAVRENYARNRSYYREYERSRNTLPHRVEAREAYQQTEAGRARSNAAKRNYLKRNPEKRLAAQLISNAIRDKKLFKPPCCTAPGCYITTNIQGHHPDYDKPLSVVWLCAACHASLHHRFTASQRMKDAA